MFFSSTATTQAAGGGFSLGAPAAAGAGQTGGFKFGGGLGLGGGQTTTASGLTLSTPSLGKIKM